MMLRFIFRRWSSKKTPTFPVELPDGMNPWCFKCGVPIRPVSIFFAACEHRFYDLPVEDE